MCSAAQTTAQPQLEPVSGDTGLNLTMLHETRSEKSVELLINLLPRYRHNFPLSCSIISKLCGNSALDNEIKSSVEKIRDTIGELRDDVETDELQRRACSVVEDWRTFVAQHNDTWKNSIQSQELADALDLMAQTMQEILSPETHDVVHDIYPREIVERLAKLYQKDTGYCFHIEIEESQQIPINLQSIKCNAVVFAEIISNLFSNAVLS